MTILNREGILNAQDAAFEDIDVPEWGGTVRVKTMTGQERDEFEASLISEKGKDQRQNLKNFRARLAALTIVGEDGKRLFSAEDVAALGQKASKPLDRVITVAQRINGLGGKEVEDLTKN